MISLKEARALMAGLVDEGMAIDLDDACHQLVDMGEIDTDQHEKLLSPAERKRCYG
jgi:hypothetical protein